MKGIVFNVLESYVDGKYGDGVFDTLVEKSLGDAQDPFVGPGTYPDSSLMSIVETAIAAKGLDPHELLVDFGKYMFHALAAKYPSFLEVHNNPKDFIKTIHDVIHVEVRKLYPEAVTPAFFYSNDSKDKLTLRYESERNLFSLAEGLLYGSGEYYKMPISVKRVDYSEEEHFCVFDLDFS
jgi:hypothetical protein